MDTINAKPRGRPRAFDRDAVLASAMDAFWTHGFEATSIPQLTEAMGISAQSLYAAFGSKEALYREAIDRYQATIGGFAARALDEEPDALDAVVRLLRDAVAAFSGNPSTPGCMITAAPAGVADTPLTLFGRQLRRDSVTRVAERLRRGVRDGQVLPETDTDAWAHYIASVVLGLSVQARDGMPVEALMSTADIAAQAIRLATRPGSRASA